MLMYAHIMYVCVCSYGIYVMEFIYIKFLQVNHIGPSNIVYNKIPLYYVHMYQYVCISITKHLHVYVKLTLMLTKEAILETLQ